MCDIRSGKLIALYWELPTAGCE